MECKPTLVQVKYDHCRRFLKKPMVYKKGAEMPLHEDKWQEWTDMDQFNQQVDYLRCDSGKQRCTC